MKDNYSSNYKKYKSKNKLKQKMISRFKTKLLKILSNEEKNITLLDVGCGEGFILDEVYNKTNIKKIVGIDINNNSLEYARKCNKKINYINCDLFKMDFKEKKFDIVMTLEVLEHFEEPAIAVKKI